jgi:NADPH2:quinone reductase
MEAAGEVIEVAGADGFHPGDKVIVKARFGCYADEIIADPDPVDAVAADIRLCAGRGVSSPRMARPGMRCMIARRSSPARYCWCTARAAVGLAAVELGKVAGATVIACASENLKLPSSAARIMPCFMAANRSRTR